MPYLTLNRGIFLSFVLIFTVELYILCSKKNHKGFAFEEDIEHGVKIHLQIKIVNRLKKIICNKKLYLFK